jgi:chemotaxis protein MotB
MKKALIAAAIIIIVALAVGAFYFYNQNAVSQHGADSLATVVDSLSAQLSGLQSRNAELTAALDTQTAALSRQKQEEIDRLKGTYDELVKDLRSEIDSGQIQITRLADRLNVSMVDRILFPSGEAEISPAGFKVLRRVGAVLNGAQGKVIRVEGHTDDVAISDRLRARFPTNWELSTTRATNVVRFLQDSVGIDPKRLRAVGLSEYHPVASNSTPKGRSQNRRIEIGLMPTTAGPEQ